MPAGWAEAGGEAVRRQVIGAAHGDLAALRVLRRVGGRGLHIEMVFAEDGEYRHFTNARRANESAMLHGDLAANGAGEGDRASDPWLS